MDRLKMTESSGGSSVPMAISSDNVNGLVLALSSSLFIGASFIIKKKGLKRAGASGVRAGVGGYSYLYEPLWWAGMITTFLLYASLVVAVVLVLIFHFVPRYGHTHILVYIGICSLMGSLSVMSVKALGIALKLTFSGMNQLIYPQTWIFAMVVSTCIITQMNYLNKDWDRQNPSQIVTEMCGFVTILSGTFLLHKTKDLSDNISSGIGGYTGLPTSLSSRISKRPEDDGFASEDIPLRRQDSFRAP